MAEQDAPDVPFWPAVMDILASDERVTPQLHGFLNLAVPQGVIGGTLYLDVPNDLTAAQVNKRQENIGARRLHTVLERLLDTLSYEAPDRDGQSVEVDRAYVDAHLGELVQDPDLSRYIL